MWCGGGKFAPRQPLVSAPLAAFGVVGAGVKDQPSQGDEVAAPRLGAVVPGGWRKGLFIVQRAGRSFHLLVVVHVVGRSRCSSSKTCRATLGDTPSTIMMSAIEAETP